jgi:hypothetical protein
LTYFIYFSLFGPLGPFSISACAEGMAKPAPVAWGYV